MEDKKIKTALVSAHQKEDLVEIVKMLHANGVTIYSTGQTASFIQELGIPVVLVSDLTGFPEILDGRVKTLHPIVFGGILSVRDNPKHVQDIETHGIPFIDLVIVDLYPFAEILNDVNAGQAEFIEHIDIGGVSLVRAAAKNFKDVVVFAGHKSFPTLTTLFENGMVTNIKQRFQYAANAFAHTAEYERIISLYFNHCADGPANNISNVNATIS